MAAIDYIDAQEILDSRQSQANTPHLVNLPVVDGALLEWQSPKNDVDIDGGLAVPEQQDTRATGEFDRVFDPGDQSMRRRDSQRGFPLRFGKHHECVDILRKPWSPEK